MAEDFGAAFVTFASTARGLPGPCRLWILAHGTLWVHVTKKYPKGPGSCYGRCFPKS